MFNYFLALELLIYIVTLFIGFKIHKSKKDKHNRIYHKYKPFLYVIIASIFLFSEYVFLKTAFLLKWVWILFAINSGFIIYFYSFVSRQTRCWKQHRMIIYNFLLIPSVYACSVILEIFSINYIFIVLGIYNILEFQFAKFSLKSKKIWD